MIKKLTLIILIYLASPFAIAESAREYFKFAKFNFDSENYVKALEFINRAIDADPQYVSGLLLRARINFSLNEFHGVIDDVTTAFDLDKNANNSMADFYLLRGDAYFKLNELNNAKKDIDYCIKLNPRNAAAYFIRGVILFEKKIYYEALENFDEAIKLDPDESNYYYQRAKLKKIHFKPLPGTRTYERIMTDIKLSVTLNPDDYRPYQLRCEMLKLDEKYSKDALIEELDKYINSFPEESAFYSERGKTKVLATNYNGAISDFTKAIHLDENNEANYRNRGVCFHNMRKYQLALNDFSKSLNLLIKKFQESGNDASLKRLMAQTFNMRGMSNKLNGNSDLACDDYYKAAKLGSKSGLNNYRKNCNVLN